MSLADRVLDGLGRAFRARAGVALVDLVEALTSAHDDADQLVQPTGRFGWAAAFDAATTPQPRWLGAATGTTVPANLDVEGQRRYLAERPAWRRGTIPAMKAAVASVLVGDGTRRVDVIERVDGDPYRFGLRVWASELPSGGAGRISDLIAAAMQEKPLGLLEDVDVEIVEQDATYAHLTATHGTYRALAARFANGAKAAAHVPEEGTVD